MSRPNFNTDISSWTTGDLQSFVQNLLSVDRSMLPPSLHFGQVTSDSDIVANGVTLTGDPRSIQNESDRAATFQIGTDTTNHQSISNGTWTEIAYTGGSSTQVSYDSGARFVSASQWTSTTAWTCPADGIYALFGQVTFEGNASGSRQLLLQATGQGSSAPNGPIVHTKVSADGTNPVPVYVSAVTSVVKDDTVAMYAFQNSGGALNIMVSQGGNGGPVRFATLSIIYVCTLNI